MMAALHGDGSLEGMARRTAVEPGDAPVGSGRLWLGLLLAPATWVVMELLGYYLAARSCAPWPGGVPLAGMSAPRVVHAIVQSIGAIVAAVGLAIAVANWRATRGEFHPGDPPARGRAHFMAFCGIIIGVLALFGVLLFNVGGLLVNPCATAR